MVKLERTILYNGSSTGAGFQAVLFLNKTSLSSLQHCINLDRLLAFSKLTQQEITEESAQQLLGELLYNPPQKRICVDHILKCVAILFGVPVHDLKSGSRAKQIAFPRQVAMYLAKELMQDSLSKIASAFGGKTHSTLLHAWKKIQQQAEQDVELKNQLLAARKKLQE